MDPEGLTRRHWTEMQGQAYEDALFRAAEVGPLALRRVENIEAGAAATEAIFALPNPLYAAGSAAFGVDIYGRPICDEERVVRAVGAVASVAIGAAAGGVSNGVVVSRGARGSPPLYRYGEFAESAGRLGKQAAAAEEVLGVHGVSVSTKPPGSGKFARVADFDDVSGHFRVVKTATDPNHYTVELPKPVTSDIAALFNKLFSDARKF